MSGLQETWLTARPGSAYCAYQIETEPGKNERLQLLSTEFASIQQHLNRPSRVGKDDLRDAAAAAWSALRRHRDEASCACTPECDEKDLATTIYY